MPPKVVKRKICEEEGDKCAGEEDLLKPQEKPSEVIEENEDDEDSSLLTLVRMLKEKKNKKNNKYLKDKTKANTSSSESWFTSSTVSFDIKARQMFLSPVGKGVRSACFNAEEFSSDNDLSVQDGETKNTSTKQTEAGNEEFESEEETNFPINKESDDADETFALELDSSCMDTSSEIKPKKRKHERKSNRSGKSTLEELGTVLSLNSSAATDIDDGMKKGESSLITYVYDVFGSKQQRGFERQYLLTLSDEGDRNWFSESNIAKNLLPEIKKKAFDIDNAMCEAPKRKRKTPAFKEKGKSRKGWHEREAEEKLKK